MGSGRTIGSAPMDPDWLEPTRVMESLVRCLLGEALRSQKVPDQLGDAIRCRIEGEMASVEYVDLRVRHVAPIRLGLRQLEREVVLAPDHQQPRLALTHPGLPLGIRLDVRPVVVEQIALNVGL